MDVRLKNETHLKKSCLSMKMDVVSSLEGEFFPARFKNTVKPNGVYSIQNRFQDTEMFLLLRSLVEDLVRALRSILRGLKQLGTFNCLRFFHYNGKR